MPETPIDPASESIDQSQRSASTHAGQQGYGVEWEKGRFKNDELQTVPTDGRSGSFETSNKGGYGTGQPDASGQRHTTEQSASPADGHTLEHLDGTNKAGEDANKTIDKKFAS
ncbi:MAG: hypothetical protein NVS4B8_08060 [Herpetosiphon sp.]